MVKTIKVMIVVFGGTGVIILCIAGIWIYKQSRFLGNSTHTSGRVVKLEADFSEDSNGRTSRLYHPVVRFAPGKLGTVTFVSSTGSNPPAFHEGDQVDVVFDPKHPESAEIYAFSTLWLGPVILCGIVAIFFLIASTIGITLRTNRKKVAWLKQFGQCVQAEIIEVSLNMSTRVNGRHPFRICAQWQNPATGAVQVFNSDNIWYNPQAFLHEKSITVWIDPQNVRRYWMDISFLPAQDGI